MDPTDTSPTTLADLDHWVERFEQAWARGVSPELHDFAPPDDAVLRRRVLFELIQVDLENRWRRQRDPCSSAALCVEAYAERLPELGPVER